MTGILSDIRVLEFTNSPSGSFCGKLLADHGATVIKIESPLTLDPLRNDPPFLETIKGGRISSAYLAFNTNKLGITLDIQNPKGRELAASLSGTSDVIIESYQPGYLNKLGLGYSDLTENNAGLIMLSITYFGQSGPYSKYKGDELTSQAIGGFLHAVTGSADKPPMGTTLNQMEITAARNGSIAIMAALIRKLDTGFGTYIDLSTVESAVATPSQLIHPFSFTGRNPKRGGSDTNVMDGMHLPTKDGEVTLTTAGTGGRPMEAWCEFLSEPRLNEPQFETRQKRLDNWEALYDLIAPKLRDWENIPLMEATMAKGLVIGLVQNPHQVLQSPHLSERGYFVTLLSEELGDLKYPGPGFFINGENIMDATRSAPSPGEHNTQILGELLGLEESQIQSLAEQGVI